MSRISIRRGSTAIERTVVNDVGAHADTVIAKLETTLAAAQKLKQL